MAPAPFFSSRAEEAARHVAANGLVEFVKDRARREQALGRAERPLHHPRLLIAKHRFERREIGVGPEHEDAVEFGVLFRLGPIDGEMVAVWRRQEAAVALAAVALVADQALVALLQPPLQRGQDRGSGGGVLSHLVAIAADDIAPPGQSDGLGLVFDVLRPLGQNERDEGRGIIEDEFAHPLVGALANAQDARSSSR